MAQWWTFSPPRFGSKARRFPTTWMRTASAAVSSNSTRFTDAPASPALLAERRSAGSWWGNAGRTTVRSASEAEDLVRHQGRGLHLKNVVNADHVRAAQDGRCHGSCGGALQKAL